MLLHPVLQGQLILRQSGENLRLFVSGAQLCLHLLHNLWDARVACVPVKGFKQIQLGVFFDFYAEVVQLLDGSVAGKEVERTRTEADNLQLRQRKDCPRNRHKFVDHLCTVVRIADRIFGNVGADVAQCEVVACVEHSAEGVASALAEITGSFLGGSYEHFGTVKVFGKQSLCDFGTKVSQVNAKGIAASLLDVLERLYHLDFTFHDADRTFIDVLAVVVLDIGLHNRFASVDRKRFREAVAANGYDADFYFGHIIGKHG